MNTVKTAETMYLSRPDGRISYTVQGTGPLIVAVPGMGDLRSSYGELVGPLVGAGYRVAVTDLRGHGESDTTFRDYGDVATGHDILALIDALGGPAVVLGNSMGASAAAWAATERPNAVAGLVLFAPFLREPKTSALGRRMTHLLYRIVFAPPWGAAFWASYYRGSLNKGTKSHALAEHVAEIRASLAEPGRLRALRALALALDHTVVQRRLAELRVPRRAFVGSLDPDFASPAAEVEWLTGTGVQAELVEDAAHYPHAQRPDVIVPATLQFLAALPRAGARGWAHRGVDPDA